MFFLRFIPGYRGLLRHGQGGFLLVALLFFAGVNATIFCQWYWTQWCHPTQSFLMWLLLVCWWIALTTLAAWLERHSVRAATPSDLLGQAMTHYLRGNWFETETTLQAILKKHPHDAESLLFYATLLRRLQRPTEARTQLNKLTALRAASRWQYEIAAEERALVGN